MKLRRFCISGLRVLARMHHGDAGLGVLVGGRGGGGGAGRRVDRLSEGWMTKLEEAGIKSAPSCRRLFTIINM